ncbi:MAG: LysE family translocator [Microcoleus sp. SM1_3_4]|nr:LysE family translocator [Microcoleus sp. SM1_3_4]
MRSRVRKHCLIIAILGLSLLAQKIGSLFFAIKYLGGAYLIWLGIGLCKSKIQDMKVEEVVKSSLISSFFTGLLITLGDQKATLFYLGFFPAFLDLSQISYFDTAIVIAIAIVSVGGVKLGYALAADRARLSIGCKIRKGINIAAGCVTIAVGIFLIAKLEGRFPVSYDNIFNLQTNLDRPVAKRFI